MHVAIIGAGPAGCAAAIALAPHTPVTLVSDGRHGVGETLSAAARPLLQQLGLLPLEQQLECLAVNTAWHGELTSHDSLRHPLGSGWLLDRRRFGEALKARAVACGATLLEPARLVGLEPGWTLQLTDRELQADFVLDATGRRGVVARRLGVKRITTRPQTAVVGQLHTLEEDPDQTLWVESHAEGWAYTCRTGPRTRVATWLAPGRPRPHDWWTNLQRTRHLPARLQGYTALSWRALPADDSHLEQPGGPGWMAIGDAARSHDPLSGRGVFDALKSGLEAGAAVLAK